MSVTRNPKERPMTAFVATSSFVNNFYNYTLSSNPTTFAVTGTLSVVTGATAANCPAGRILKENGRRLYSNADPGISTFMVGVIDSVTGYAGLIDPNASLFQRYTNERAADLADGLDYSVGSGSNHRGDSTFTWGNVVAGGNVVANTQLQSGAGVVALTNSNAVNLTNGQYFTYVMAATTTLAATAVPPAGTVTFLSLTGAYTATFGALYKMTTTTAAPAASNIVVTLVSDGTNMREVSRNFTVV
jgi:hypothetical protein